MKIIVIVVIILLQGTVFAQSFTDKIVKEFSFEKKGVENTLMIANINGNIKVTGYDGDQVLIEVTRTITAKTTERLEKGKAQIKLGVLDRADTIILFTEGLCNSFGKNKGNGGWSKSGWGYEWNHKDDDCKELVDHTFNYDIKIPMSVNLIMSTVNQGHLDAENLKGSIMANNVNGSIKLVNIFREASASTINGNVDITYAKNPDKACRFYTLNGDINAWFKKDLSANMSFESFNGELFTNVPNLQSLPATVEKKETEKGTKFKVNGNRFRIGNGGVVLDFETFNGNVYVKEKI